MWVALCSNILAYRVQWCNYTCLLYTVDINLTKSLVSMSKLSVNCGLGSQYVCRMNFIPSLYSIPPNAYLYCPSFRPPPFDFLDTEERQKMMKGVWKSLSDPEAINLWANLPSTILGHVSKLLWMYCKPKSQLELNLDLESRLGFNRHLGVSIVLCVISRSVYELLGWNYI